MVASRRMARVRAATAGGFPVGGPVQDPAATALGQEPRSLIIPNQQPGANEEIGLGYVAIPGRLSGGVAIRVDSAVVNLDIAKLEPGGDTGTPDQWWIPAWNGGSAVEQVRRVPVAAIPVDAPADGQQWARSDHAWEVVAVPPTNWTDIENLPPTFPPTLPIPQSGVTGLEADQTAQNDRLTAVEGVNASQATDIAGKEPAIAPGSAGSFWRGDKTWQPVTVNWNAVTGKPSTFPPDAHTHSAAQITDFAEGVDDRVAVLIQNGTGITWAYNDTAGTLTPTVTVSGGVDAYTKAESDAKYIELAGDTMTGPLTLVASVTGGNQATTKNYVDNAVATREPLVPGGTTDQFWRGDKTWATPPGGGGGGAASGITYTPSAPLVATNVQAAIDEVLTDFLQLTGGTVTGKTTFSSTAAASASINIAARSNNPSSPVNGDIWINQSSFYFRNQSVTRELATRGGNIFTGNQTLPAGTTSQTPLTIPHGVAPTTPVNGDIWTETTGLYVRVNGVTKGPLLDAVSAPGWKVVPGGDFVIAADTAVVGPLTIPAAARLLRITGIVLCSVTNGSYFMMRASIDGGATFKSTAATDYYNGYLYKGAAAVSGASNQTTYSGMVLAGDPEAAGYGSTFEVIVNVGIDATLYPSSRSSGIGMTSGTGADIAIYDAMLRFQNQIDAIQFLWATGNVKANSRILVEYL